MESKSAQILTLLGRGARFLALTAGAFLTVLVVVIAVAWDADLYLLRAKYETVKDALFGPYQPHQLSESASTAICPAERAGFPSLY